MKRIVVVEDDRYLREELVFTFQKAGYDVESVTSFTCTAERIPPMQPDLVVLDVNLPGESGFAVCKYLKERISAPILILTARDSLSDELKGLGLGADDYLTKPCPSARLLARAQRLIQTFSGMKSFIKAGPLLLDTDTWKLSFGENAVILAENEGKTGVWRMIFVDGKAVGNISVEQKEDVYRRDGEIGYLLLTEYWSKGIMTEAAKEICRIAFEKLDIIRITGLYYGPNTASGRVLEKLGFTLEGTLRQHEMCRGELIDIQILGLLRDDWN